MAANVLEERTRSHYDTLTKSCKKVADFLLSHMEDAAFLDISHLSKEIQVSETTVIRFARAVGYDGFTGMQQDVRGWLKERVTPQERMERSKFKKSSELYESILDTDIRNLKDLRAEFFEEKIQEVVRTMARGRHTYIMGYRTSFPMASLLYMFLIQIMPQVELIDMSGGAIYDRIAGWGENDALVAFSFPRYSRITLEIGQCAKSRGCTLVGITDNPLSPLGRIADISLPVRCESPAFFNSMAACLSLINCLAGGIALIKGKDSIAQLRHRDKMIKQLRILV